MTYVCSVQASPEQHVQFALSRAWSFEPQWGKSILLIDSLGTYKILVTRFFPSNSFTCCSHSPSSPWSPFQDSNKYMCFFECELYNPCQHVRHVLLMSSYSSSAVSLVLVRPDALLRILNAQLSTRFDCNQHSLRCISKFVNTYLLIAELILLRLVYWLIHTHPGRVGAKDDTDLSGHKHDWVLPQPQGYPCCNVLHAEKGASRKGPNVTCLEFLVNYVLLDPNLLLVWVYSLAWSNHIQGLLIRMRWYDRAWYSSSFITELSMWVVDQTTCIVSSIFMSQ